jgi:hypothetical protein
MIDLDGLAGVALLFYLYGIFDVLTTDKELVRNLPKSVWLLVVVVFPDFGLMAWRLLGRPAKAVWRPDGGAQREQRWTGGSAHTPPPPGIDPPSPADGADTAPAAPPPADAGQRTPRRPVSPFGPLGLPPDLPAAEAARAWLARVVPGAAPGTAPAAPAQTEEDVMAAIAERDRLIAQWAAESAQLAESAPSAESAEDAGGRPLDEQAHTA